MAKIEINNVHVSAFSKLTRTWKRLPQLKVQTGLGETATVALDDLTALGMAEVKREPIMCGKTQRGEMTFFRMTSAMFKVKGHILTGA